MLALNSNEISLFTILYVSEYSQSPSLLHNMSAQQDTNFHLLQGRSLVEMTFTDNNNHIALPLKVYLVSLLTFHEN